jgi:hypothetical protein
LLASSQSLNFNSNKNVNTKKHSPRAIAVNPGAVASDIWRGVPWCIKTFLFDPLMTLTFLNTDEGATSIAAALNPLSCLFETNSIQTNINEVEENDKFVPDSSSSS